MITKFKIFESQTITQFIDKLEEINTNIFMKYVDENLSDELLLKLIFEISNSYDLLEKELDVWMKYILDKGATKFINNQIEDNTPLIWASYHSNQYDDVKTLEDNNFFKCVKVLIDYGAKWEIIDDDNKDFLYYLGEVYYDNISLKSMIIREYPKKYKDYKLLKNLNKFDI